METKKTPKANLENKRPTWLLVGYVTVLAFMFVAFEWTRDVRVDTNATNMKARMYLSRTWRSLLQGSLK